MFNSGSILILVFVNFASFHAQSSTPYQCTCACCNSPGCMPSLMGYAQSSVCSAEACLTQCRCAYSQCLTLPPYGQAIATCSSSIQVPGYCQCRCCNTGSTNCQPNFVGEAVAGTCTVEGCSIACYVRYPGLCGFNQSGITLGLCTGPVTTTTLMSTTLQPVWLGNVCVCTFCQSAVACYSPLFLGATSSAQCSTSSCTQACQSRFTPSCATTNYQGQVTGMCPSLAMGNIKCRCNCCGASIGCIDYDLNINGTCTSCQGACQQVSPCGNLYGATSICSFNRMNSLMHRSLTNILIFTMISILFSFAYL